MNIRIRFQTLIDVTGVIIHPNISLVELGSNIVKCGLFGEVCVFEFVLVRNGFPLIFIV